MPQEALLVALSSIGPIIGSAIGVWKRPSAAYIYNMLYFAARYLFGQISPATMSILVGATAGLMIYITADELMPAAQNLGGRQSVFSFIGGFMAVMVLDLIA